jgi:sterol desaturase/sphingolipid hydroxylase (fatty acid hydroxylase superfamily)
MAWLRGLAEGHHLSEWYLLAGALLWFGLWEIFVPNRPAGSALSSRIGSHLTLFLLAAGLSFLIIPLPGVAFALAIQKSRWGIAIANVLPWPLRFFAGILMLDFVRYVAHFAFHTIGPLWRVHAIHHSDVDFDITTGLRHHPLEVVIMAGAEFAAIALFVIPASSVFVLSCVVIAHALFSHANVSLPPALERILRRVIVTPQFHEVHHSIDLSEQKANLGNVFPWWDRLFGTAIEESRLGSSLRFGLDESQRSPHLNVLRILVDPFVASSSPALPAEAPAQPQNS